MIASTQDLERTQKLAQKGLWTTGLLTFFFPLLGYMYTGRYKALLKGFGICLGALFVFFLINPSAADDEDSANGIFFLYLVGATIDNTRAVRKAKNSVGTQPVLNPDLNVKLLKLAKAKGEISLADCVIETSLPPEKIQGVLNDLQRQDLIRVANRSSDGAVVYRIV
ncbi:MULTISPECIES: hypothetical protein [Desertifilum]|uniref:Uncharacterized protein n=1 Tax=Desertifilum tharense IPPAS B-1220 TaxID=1781255 RepID=A0ACD5GZQ7_9CYAN|nr:MULTISPECIES: hypothetical protein [Desertifilum]MDA0209232.1 hypothetical protein [Cyanobacteria bacterium FC1]